MRHTLLMTGFSLALAMSSLLVGNEARAQFHFNYSAGTGDPRDWVAYGDSIIAGYCGIFCPATKSYASYFADEAAAENGWAIDLAGFPHSGETTIQIYDEMANTHNAQLQAADGIVWSAGGNDFLDARDDYASSCDVAALDQALSDFRDDWDLIIALVSSQAAPGALIRTMDIYYPDPDVDRTNFCGAVSDFEVFFPRLLAAGDYMCDTAIAAGFDCASSMVAMNCDEIDAAHTIDPDCFDISGANIRDPLDVIKYVDGVPTSWSTATLSGMIQFDRTHPGRVGQQYIGAAHHDLGYAPEPSMGVSLSAGIILLAWLERRRRI
jgi:lysophospholipase L1-like esterase